MKVYVHRTPLTENEPFDLLKVKAHARVDHDDDDSALTQMAHAAAADIEATAQIALLRQTIKVTIIHADLSPSFVPLPVGPLIDEDSVSVEIDGEPFTAFAAIGGVRAHLRLRGFQRCWADSVTITYEAGFGPSADSIPHDLSQAITDQAALFYDCRGMADAKAAVSPHLSRIAARYRGVRL